MNKLIVITQILATTSIVLNSAQGNITALIATSSICMVVSFALFIGYITGE